MAGNWQKGNLQKILIVDGDHLMLYGLSKALSRKSFEVVTATTARQALLSLDCDHLALCLINFHLPDANGLELMEEIRERCPGTRTVLMTASFISDPAMREKVKAAVTVGECLFLAKPFNLAEAIDLVFRAIAGGLNQQGLRKMADGHPDRKRKFQRKPFVKIIDIFATVIGEGEIKRHAWHAVSTDICDEGIGLLGNLPFNRSQVVSFGEELSGRTGVVAWCTRLDNKLCRAGIKFI